MKGRSSRAGMIVIEGVDGAGKGVQCRRLADTIRAAGYEVILTREPGGSPGAESIRRLLVEGEPDRWDSMTELLLMYAARRTHLVETILPALDRGCWVVCDRFSDSSMSFQGIAGNLGRETVESIHQLVVGDFVPDVTIVLDIDPQIALGRAAARGGGEDRFERKGMEYHRRVRDAFREIAVADPARHLLIDGSQPMDRVTEEILGAIETRLGLVL